MLYIFLGIVAIIVFLTIIMFFLLKNLVNSVNEKSKNYFIEKVQEYDMLKNTEVKEDKTVNDINLNIAQAEVKSDGLIESSVIENIPDYQVNDFLTKYKEINSKFDFNYNDIIKDFIKNNFKDDDLNYYKILLNIKSKINFDIIYDLYTKSNEPLIYLEKMLNEKELVVFKTFTQFGNENFEDFVNYINNELDKHDPYFYIQVGTSKENYNYISPLVRTIVNDNIYRGIIIKYKNCIYDYSLN